MSPKFRNLFLLASVYSLTAFGAPVAALAAPQDNGASAGGAASASTGTSFADGIAAFKKGDIIAATAAMKSAVASDPKSAEAQAWYGYLLLRQDNATEAIPYLETAVSLKPTSDAYTNLGNALLIKPGRTQADTVRAREMFGKAAAAAPKSAEAQFNLGIAASRVGDYAGSAAAYRQVHF